MHIEFPMLYQLFKICLEEAISKDCSSISEINIEVGDFTPIDEIYTQQAFNSLKNGTIAENAVLTIKRTPGILHCNTCNQNSEIWVNKEKEKAANEGRLEEYEQYAKAINLETLLTADPNLGTDLFHCRKCSSSHTTLIEGKGVTIKNIRT